MPASIHQPQNHIAVIGKLDATQHRLRTCSACTCRTRAHNLNPAPRVCPSHPLIYGGITCMHVAFGIIQRKRHNRRTQKGACCHIKLKDMRKQIGLIIRIFARRNHADIHLIAIKFHAKRTSNPIRCRQSRQRIGRNITCHNRTRSFGRIANVNHDQLAGK